MSPTKQAHEHDYTKVATTSVIDVKPLTCWFHAIPSELLGDNVKYYEYSTLLRLLPPAPAG